MSDYSEDSLVEQPAIALFAAMEWETVNGFHEFNQAGTSPLGREAKSEVVLAPRLRLALERLNPDLPAEAFDQAIEELIRDRSAMAPSQANREVYLLLKNGVQVKISAPDSEGETVESVRLIDWKTPDNNDFLLVNQFWVTGEMYTRRADLVGFVNGIPLVFIELKASHARLETAYTGNLSDYKNAIPQLFWYNALIILSNGSHSQYDTLALNMRTALPNASFIAFTGTPLIVGEEKTREVFGDYVSVYDFRQSVEDGATVPLYYENRIPELQLTNENLNEEMERLLEEVELDEAQEKKLEREFTRQYHLITREERLETIAEDLVRHFTGRGFPGKAMVISIDKATAVRMYDKVQAQWKAGISRLMDKMAGTLSDEGRQALKERLQFMEATDMAVVVSPSQNEIGEMKAKGLGIVPHRKRMVSEDLETKFKNPDDPFRIVFVCAMWLTGFDAPSCSTIYLDKPMRNHTLMQTIARANRVFKEKINGLIVDYVGVFRNLEKALAIYGAGDASENGDSPVKDKAVLVALLRQSIREIEVFCMGLGVNLEPIQSTTGFEQIKLLDDAVEALIVNDNSKKRYLSQAGTIWRLYKAILPDSEAKAFASRCLLIDVLAKKIQALKRPADISEVMNRVEALLDESIDTEGYVIRETAPTYGEKHWVDLAQIDFVALKEKFAKGRKHTEAEKLKGQVNSKLRQMVRLNRTRVDYLERFQRMIDEYNAGSLNVDEFFRQLLAFAKTLKEEEKRSITEQLSEEELVLFDILTKPHMELADKDIKQVKKAARNLLDSLKGGKLILDWRKFQRSRAAVKICIEDVLDEALPQSFTPELYQQKVEAVYQHVFDSYYGGGRGVYAASP